MGAGSADWEESQNIKLQYIVKKVTLIIFSMSFIESGKYFYSGRVLSASPRN